MGQYEDLMVFQRETQVLASVAGRLSWDQEAMMPRGASTQRSEELATMASMIHARRTDSRVGEWLAAIDEKALDQVAQAQIRHMRREFDRATRVPGALEREIAVQSSRAHAIWAEARADDDFLAFAPTLTTLIDLRRQQGQALADGGDVYDALLDGYEPDAKSAELDAMFAALRPRLVALREAILQRPHGHALDGVFDAKQQMALSRIVAGAFGYDFERGRIDKAVHPFSSGSGNDVRITTRTEALDPFGCIYSTIHEVGHACYEQNISQDYLFTPLGQGVSMGVHESQSRIYENQLGRSRAFSGWLFGQLKDQFGDFAIANEEAFYAAVNTVHNGYIRTEADEVQYNLHVLLRFDLERALISGDLQVRDLEAAWNDRFRADFGFAVDKPSNGVLQDVHWAAGYFGYFPTYSLGNVYAGCLYKALCRDVPDFEDALAKGDARPATAWLRDNLQVHGGLYSPREVVERASGQAPDEAPLLEYLEGKFGALYRL